jgi:hypothetical protein
MILLQEYLYSDRLIELEVFFEKYSIKKARSCITLAVRYRVQWLLAGRLSMIYYCTFRKTKKVSDTFFYKRKNLSNHAAFSIFWTRETVPLNC